MLKLDNNLLNEIGLGGLPEEQKKGMLQHIYETLELRVGTDLANQMTDQQLEEFEKFIDEGGDANQSQALQWLETNLPNYKQVVNQVFETLKGEIAQMAPQIMATSAPAPQMGQPASQPQQQPAYQQPAPQPTYQQPPQQYQQPMPSSQPVDPTAQPYAQPQAPQVQQQYQQAVQQPASGQPQNNAQTYQYPQQQPPAGPGAGQPPQYPTDQ